MCIRDRFLPIGSFAQPGFVGSEQSKNCHQATYDRWRKTRMANVVRDPRVNPDAITPDWSKPDPLVKFTVGDIAWVYGGKWKQRYFTRAETTTILLARNGTSASAFGGPTWWLRIRTGGSRIFRPTI